MINDVEMLKIYATPYGNDPILYSRVNCFMTCKYLTSVPPLLLFFDKSKRYSFIQIDGVHRYITNPNSLKTERMNL